jgi:diguanylate cyclase (GGDEF)-like protein
MSAMAISADGARARLRWVVQLLEAREYHAVGASRRFRATQRRLIWGATRAGMLVVAVAAPSHVIVLSALHPLHVGFFLLVDGSLGVVAIAAWWALAHGMRRRPEPIAFLVSLGVMLTAIAIAVGEPKLVGMAIAYLMFVPTVVALVIPWRPMTEARWLATYAAAGVVFLALVPAPSLPAGDRGDLVVALATSLMASFVGHALLFRQHVRTFSQMQAIASLGRRENGQRVELERVYRTLEITARTDELTRVGNRMKLAEDLAAVRARLGRTSRPIGLLEVDLDHFKSVNDHYGHLAGDAVLREVSGVIRSTVRADDSVYRYGGEEFLVILENISGGVEAAGRRLCLAVEGLHLAHPDNPPYGQVTVSVGALSLGATDLAMSTDEWFARVDAALYEAKACGRNRVALARIPEGAPSPGLNPERAGRRVRRASVGQTI